MPRSPRSSPAKRARLSSRSPERFFGAQQREARVALNTNFDAELTQAIEKLKTDRVYKRLNYLDSPQGARVQMEGRGEVVILSSNNYLGLSNEREVVDAGIAGLERFGAGTGSVRFICGTFTVHRDLETAIARLVGTPASLSYVSAWNANEGLTASIVEQNDFVVSDALNHASIIDSIRLAKAITKCTTAVYAHSDLDDLKAKLEGAKTARRRIIWTDGVFSMEGSIARLPEILELARRYDAIVVMDDSHGTGVLGRTGRGTAEHFGVLGEVDVITSTLGKALGGAAGGFVAGPEALCDMLTQRSRPQLFSNALPPTVAASALCAIEHLEAHPDLVTKLRENTRYFREAISEAGFKPLPGETPIVPIIVGETATAIQMSDMLLGEGVFVTGFGFPVVPQGQARVRCQLSAAHSRDDLDKAIAAFKTVGKKLGII
ncbi:MAG: glycine C-acetyltransferase [Gemmatimonadaceae bacterium]|nr:glycine C-acetyltransferase [Gemmatimonadaceae bacterium]